MKKVSKKNNQAIDSSELIIAMDELEKEKGIKKEYLLEAIKTALVTAYKRNFDSAENVKITMDKKTGEIHVYAEKDVVEKPEEVENNKLTLVAVDGFRLALRSVFLTKQSNDFKAVIPGKTLNELNKIITDSFEPIKMGVSKNQALFEMDNCKIVTRILDGEFLNYSNVIPKNWETRIRINKNNLTT